MHKRRAKSARILWPGALFVAFAVLVGCGVPVDSGPTALSKTKVPFGLLDASVPTPTTTAPPPVEVSVTIFLVGPNGRLVGVSRDVPIPAALSQVLGALVEGPTQAESTGGISSAVPGQTVVLGATESNGLATVNLGGTFAQLVGPSQIEAVAQIVFTVTAFAGINSIEFELSGQPVDVPVANGAQVPVASRAQFVSLAP